MVPKFAQPTTSLSSSGLGKQPVIKLNYYGCLEMMFLLYLYEYDERRTVIEALLGS